MLFTTKLSLILLKFHCEVLMNWNVQCGVTLTFYCPVHTITFTESQGFLFHFFFFGLLSLSLILDKWPTWRTILSMYLFSFLTLCMFRAHRAHNERQIVSIQPLVAVGGRVACRSEENFWPACDTATDTEWQLQEVVLTHFVSPDDKHDVLETCRELKIKIST